MSRFGLDRILQGSERAQGRKYRKYDLVILGENHVSDTDLEKEIEIVRKLKPGYLLMEGFNDLKPVRLSEALPPVHLNIKSELLDGISDASEYRAQYSKLSQLYSSIKNNVEKSKSMLKEKGVYDLSPAAIKGLSDEEADELFDVMEQKQNYVSMRNFIKKHPKFEDTLKVPFTELPNAYIKSLLKHVLKDYRQENAVSEKLLYLLKSASKSEISGGINHIQMLSEAYKNNRNIVIAGIDFGYGKKFTADNKKREEEMGTLLAKYAKEAKQYSMKAFAVVGRAHLRKGSPLFDYLENAGLSYKVFKPNSSYSLARAAVYSAYVSNISSQDLNDYRKNS